MTQDQTQQYTCRVCGYLNKRPFYEEGGATSEICPCCGSESGYHDFTPDGVEMNRRRWIKEEVPWFHPELKPENWNLAEQLRRIGVDLKDYQADK